MTVGTPHGFQQTGDFPADNLRRGVHEHRVKVALQGDVARHQPAHDPDGLIPADVRSILENAIAHDLNRRLPTVDDIKTALVPALMGQRTI